MRPTEMAASLQKRYDRLGDCVGSDFQRRCKSIVEFIDKHPETRAIAAVLESLERLDVVRPCLIDSTKAARELSSEQFAAVCFHQVKRVARRATEAEKALVPEGRTGEHAFEMFRRRFLEPLVEYFEDSLTNQLQVLPVLLKYKRIIEWTDNELSTLVSGKSIVREDALEKHLFRYLLGEGLWFTPRQLQIGKRGRADLALYQDAQVIPMELKPFNGKKRGRECVRQGFLQAVDYATELQSPVGYLVVFNLCKGGRLQFGGAGSQEAPSFDYGGKRIFVVSIQVADLADSPSKRAKTDFVFKYEDLIPTAIGGES